MKGWKRSISRSWTISGSTQTWNSKISSWGSTTWSQVCITIWTCGLSNQTTSTEAGVWCFSTRWNSYASCLESTRTQATRQTFKFTMQFLKSIKMKRTLPTERMLKNNIQSLRSKKTKLRILLKQRGISTSKPMSNQRFTWSRSILNDLYWLITVSLTSDFGFS